MEICSDWREGEALMGQAQIRIFNALEEIRQRSRFVWLGINSDNSNAFINDQLYCYSQQEKLESTRSRPYRKNDNAYIKQKNFPLCASP